MYLICFDPNFAIKVLLFLFNPSYCSCIWLFRSIFDHITCTSKQVTLLCSASEEKQSIQVSLQSNNQRCEIDELTWLLTSCSHLKSQDVSSIHLVYQFVTNANPRSDCQSTISSNISSMNISTACF